MTDETATPAEQPQEAAPRSFVIVPTMEDHLELAERVAGLEERQPAEEDDSDVHARLDRHRAELEEIKRRYNGLLRYLGLAPAEQPEPAPTPAPTSQESYQ